MLQFQVIGTTLASKVCICPYKVNFDCLEDVGIVIVFQLLQDRYTQLIAYTFTSV